MAKGAGKCSGGVVVELGSGTGAVTKSLVESGFAKSSKLYCVEFDASLANLLSKKFPEAVVVNGSAEDISAILGEDAAALKAIVSSLPLLSLPKDCVKRIISESERVLPKGGRFVQFTYNLKRDPAELGFKLMRHVEYSRIWLNIPPARVDVFEKL